MNKVDPVLNAVNVKVVNDNLGEKGTLSLKKLKAAKPAGSLISHLQQCQKGDETSCSWVPVSYRCNVVKAMDDEGKEGGFIPSIVKKLVNYYLPSFIKEYILWYLTNDFGVYLQNSLNQSFAIEGEFTMNGTKLSVLKSNISKNSEESQEALKLLGNLTFSQAKLLMKARELIGKTFGSSWQTKWDCVHGLKTYIQHMYGLMENRDEWILFKESWQSLVDHVYAPSVDFNPATKQKGNTDASDGETIFKVLNIESIFESVVTLMKKPVHAHLLLHSASAKLNLNKFSKMQRDVTLFAIQRSLEMETASGNETKKKTNLQDGESINDIAENSSISLRAQRHQIAINLLEQWYDNRVDTLNLIGDCIRFLKTDFEVKLSGGANGLLSIVSNNINASLPECVRHVKEEVVDAKR